jgi:uncharacterized delta-60 repeat protein
MKYFFFKSWMPKSEFFFNIRSIRHIRVIILALITCGMASAQSIDTAYGANGYSENVSGNTVATVQTADGAIIYASVLSQKIKIRRLVNGVTDMTIGIVSYGLQNFDNYVEQMAVLPNQQILVVGSAHANGISKVIFMRLNPDLSLDNTFGTDGYVSELAGIASHLYPVLVVDGDGNFYVAGKHTAAYTNFAAKFNASGQLQTSFGSQGILLLDTVVNNISLYIRSMVLTVDGRIITAGSRKIGSDDVDRCLNAFNLDGTLSTGFGDNGTVIVDYNGTNDYSAELILVEDGKLLLGGVSNGSPTLTRLLPDGSLDTGFGIGGKLILEKPSFFFPSTLSDMVVLPDGKYLLFGSSMWYSVDAVPFLFRYNVNGTKDLSFNGIGGYCAADTNHQWGARNMHLQQDGSAILSIYVNTSSTNQYFGTTVKINSMVLSTDMEQKDDFSFYPNPASETVFFENSDNIVLEPIKLYDMQGREVLKAPLRSDNSINISTLQSGTYLIKFAGEKTSRIIKK